MERTKSSLLTSLLDSVKCSQSKFGSRTELATENDPSVQQLCRAYENVFLHGFLKKCSSGAGSTKGIWSVTESLVPNSLWSTEPPNFWPLIKSQLSKHEAQRFLLLHNVRTDLGRGRAWLRASLNEHSLERYILEFLSLDNLHLYYDSNAFLRDEELSSILPQTAAGLGSVLFALIVDNPDLDKNLEMYQPPIEEPIAESLPELAEVADLVLNPQPPTTTKSSDSSKLHKKPKKKKKIPTTLVSFDDHEPSSSATEQRSPYPKSKSSTSSLETVESQNQSHNQTPVPVVTPNPKPNVPKIYCNEEPKSPATIEKSIPRSIERETSDCISTYSDCSERFEISNLEISGTSPSERLKPVRVEEDGSSQPGDLSDKNNDLIPVPNYSGSGSGDEHENHNHHNFAGYGEPERESTDFKFQMDSVSIGNESNYDGLSLGLGDERVNKLRTILDHEVEIVSSLKAQLAEEKRKSNDHYRILETRIETLTKENELLKHQLKKYIGAVQLLRDGNRRLSIEEDAVDQNISESVHSGTVDSATEAAEYERKLIQVAEMHGELMEFNAHLQTILKKKDIALRRLREELVDLRGPISSTTNLENEDDDLICSYENLDNNRSSGSLARQTSSLNERVLINIWVPSAFLTGATNDLHHVYQVFIRIKDTEWNVYRRYSEFYNLHKELKKNNSVIGTFYFPPKKHIGNKDTKFVDERRRKLQEYLRNLINHILKTNSILASHPDKNLLISILPFFGEQNQPKSKRSRNQSRKNLFFRNSDRDSSGQAGLSESVPNYAHYTGL